MTVAYPSHIVKMFYIHSTLIIHLYYKLINTNLTIILVFPTKQLKSLLVLVLLYLQHYQYYKLLFTKTCNIPEISYLAGKELGLAIGWLGLVIVVFPGHVVNLYYIYSTMIVDPYSCTISCYTLTLQYPWHFLPSR